MSIHPQSSQLIDHLMWSAITAGLGIAVGVVLGIVIGVHLATGRVRAAGAPAPTLPPMSLSPMTAQYVIALPGTIPAPPTVTTSLPSSAVQEIGR